MAHWPRRTAMLLAAVLTTAAIGVAPAEAGGPTSVLLSAPNIPKVVATGYEDKAYGELRQLLETSADAGAAAEHAGGEFIRATWLIHDMSVWRLDLIYPDAPGGPWIATTEDRDGSGRMPSEPVWHRAADDVRLIKLLVSMGLLGGQRGDRNVGGPTSPPQAGTETTATPEVLPA